MLKLFSLTTGDKHDNHHHHPPDDRLQKLKELSSFFRISTEDLIRVSIEDLITRPDEEFERIVEYVLEKRRTV